MAGDDEAVAAIVAGAAENEYRPRAEPADDGIGDGAAGILHKRGRGNPGGCCQRISAIHLGRGQKFARHERSRRFLIFFAIVRSVPQDGSLPQRRRKRSTPCLAAITKQ
jgi:hypothetical protein